MANTGESAEDLPTEDAITRLRFRLDGLKERVKRIWAAMHGDEEREPLDYEHDIADRVARIISHKYGRRWHVEYHNGDDDGHDGEKRMLSWILGVLSALAVTVIVGGVTLYGEFTALRATVTTGMNAHEQRINRLEADRDRAQPRPP